MVACAWGVLASIRMPFCFAQIFLGLILFPAMPGVGGCRRPQKGQGFGALPFLWSYQTLFAECLSETR